MRLEAWQGVAVRTMESGAAQVAQLKQALEEKTEQLALLQAECDSLKASKSIAAVCLLTVLRPTSPSIIKCSINERVTQSTNQPSSQSPISAMHKCFVELQAQRPSCCAGSKGRSVWRPG